MMCRVKACLARTEDLVVLSFGLERMMTWTVPSRPRNAESKRAKKQRQNALIKRKN